jgi:AGCS family alanine or glycine:cation symporter
MVAMLGPLVDTLIICTLTALAILVTDAHLVQDADTGILLTGAQLTTQAFQLGLSDKGQWIVGISLVFFAFSTTIAWSYYGDRCTEYLLGSWAIPLYRVVYVLCIFVGANMQLSIVWALADMFNAMMAVPNLVGLVLLSGVVATDTKDYVQRLRAGAFNDYGTKSG